MYGLRDQTILTETCMTKMIKGTRQKQKNDKRIQRILTEMCINNNQRVSTDSCNYGLNDQIARAEMFVT